AKTWLNEISDLKRTERARQKVWKLRSNPQFNYIGVGYDSDEKVRYITAVADPGAAKRMAFTEVGDISDATKEIVEPHHRYIWTVKAEGETPAFFVKVYGDNPQFVTIFTLSKVNGPGTADEDDD